MSQKHRQFIRKQKMRAMELSQGRHEVVSDMIGRAAENKPKWLPRFIWVKLLERIFQ